MDGYWSTKVSRRRVVGGLAATGWGLPRWRLSVAEGQRQRWQNERGSLFVGQQARRYHIKGC